MQLLAFCIPVLSVFSLSPMDLLVGLRKNISVPLNTGHFHRLCYSGVFITALFGLTRLKTAVVVTQPVKCARSQ